jgi:hypothetical protein
MALSLAVHQGLKISIGNHCLEVKAIMPPLRTDEANQIVVSVDGGEEILVTERSKTMILPEVFVFSGRGATGNTRRLAFEAPKQIVIHRLP